MKTFELRLIPPDLHAAIKAAAFREGVSMNKWILKAVYNELEAGPPFKPMGVCRKHGEYYLDAPDSPCPACSD